MSAYAIIHRSHAPKAALAAARDILRARLLLPEDEEIPAWSVFANGDDYTESFDAAAAFLAKQLAGQASLTVIADGIDVEQLHPIAHAPTWSGLVAALALAFPEIRWHFTGIHLRLPGKNSEETTGFAVGEQARSLDEDEELRREARMLRAFYGIDTLIEPRGPALFDGYGLRGVIHRHINGKGRGNDDGISRLPLRKHVAVVIDEEPDYSLFESLMAYGRGFRVHAVTTWAESKRLLGQDGWLTPPDEGHGTEVEERIQVKNTRKIRQTASASLLLTIEDLFLNFPDEHEDGMSDLARRDATLPALRRDKAPRLRRRFVSVGHHRPQDYGKSRKNDEFVRKRLLHERTFSNARLNGQALTEENLFVYKPVCGIYALWNKLAMDRVFPGKSGKELEKNTDTPGLAPGFRWPPRKDEVIGQNEASDHSAPGRLLRLAECLLGRAATLLTAEETVASAIRGAVLAGDALEMIGLRTPTTTLRALDLMHRFEVIAECFFSGMEYHLAIKERVKDMREDLQATARWLDKSRRLDFELNGEAKILAHLIVILEGHGSFEETEECRDQLRDVHFKITRRAMWGRKSWLLMLLPVQGYTTWILRSLMRFFIAITLLVILLTGLYAWAAWNEIPDDFKKDTNTLQLFIKTTPRFAYMASCGLFAQAQSPEAVFGQEEKADDNGDRRKKPSGWLLLVNFFAIAAGFFHFGVFVSHIYALISRR
ncbi:MAG: hypothetical protein LBU39_08380 [Desulfobulbaceae bacterium]|jgi:hypothetical protein|nr:hypothetical protein [Desulfobulbaceae bacterium]